MSQTSEIEVRISGKQLRVPAIQIGNRHLIATGKWVKTATVQDEMFLETEAVEDPELCIRQLKAQKFKADILAFSQKFTETKPKYDYPYDWDNAAIISTESFEAWWECLPQEARKNVRRAGRRGVTVKAVPFDDELARGIMAIYNETPVRQGKRFWHYGKDFETVKKESSTFPERSEFIGAYHGAELIGFIKMVYCGDAAGIMGIVSKNSHYDKRPTNALLAKAVEICNKKKIAYLVYGKYVYGNRTESPLIEFKRRNGFQQARFPRYYVPLTWKGRIAVKLRLYRGLTGMLPARLVVFLVNLRSRILDKFVALRASQKQLGSLAQGAGMATEKAE